MASSAKKDKATIGGRVRDLLSRKRPLSYDEIISIVKTEFEGAGTSKQSIQWYASRMRKEGKEPHVKSA